MATATSRPPGLRGYDARWSDATGTALVGPDGSLLNLPSTHVLNGSNLHWSANKLAEMHRAVVKQFVSMQIGDSVASHNYAAMTALASRAFGVGGVAGLQSTSLSTTTVSGTMTALTTAFDVFMNGYVHDCSGAVMRYGYSGGIYTGNYFAVYIAKRPGDGTVTVELLDVSNVVQSTVATGVSCDGALTDDLLVISVTLGAVAARKIQVTVTGTCAIVGVALADRTTVNHLGVSINTGGLELSSLTDDGLMRAGQMAADLGVDLLHVCFREGTIGNIATHMPRLIAAFDAEVTEADWLFVGPTAGYVDEGLALASQPSYIMSQELRAVALARDAVFVDAYAILGSYEDILARDATFDGVHVNVDEQRTIAMVVASQTPLYALINRDYMSADTLPRNSLRITKTGATSAITDTAEIKTDGTGLDLIIGSSRYTDLKSLDGTMVMLRSVNQTGVAWGLIHGAGQNLAAGWYPADGAWSIVVNGTTGSAVLYSKISGVVHQLRLGTANLNALTGSATYDPASLADGEGVTTTVTVTGAALGDYVDQLSFSLDLQGILNTAWVSAADTVSVRFQNETGGPIDLGSGTIRVLVRKA